MASFANQHGHQILGALIKVIQANKQYLSDIDGKIGDGDHGINMNKGFTLCAEQLPEGCDLTTGLKTLSRILISQIGGSMGPLYGTLFRSMAKQCRDLDRIDANTFAAMLDAARQGIAGISEAKVGDKTMIDVLVPAEEAFQSALKEGLDFEAALQRMAEVAGTSRDATEDMVAKVGRSSRLGERSRGVIDAGAASCCLILQAFAESIQALLVQGDES